MSFITLAERFEQRSKDIYNKFSPSGFQYVTVKPDTDGVFGSRSRIKNDNRSVPTVSVLRDTQRVSKFLGSADGRLFIAKQALLQTGNTFVDTKLYNPVSPLANVVPFLHVRRNIVQSLLREPAPGLLQNSTVNTISSKFEISKQIRNLNKLDTSRRALVPAIRNIAKSYLSTQLKNVGNAILPISPTYASSRPEYKTFSDVTGPMVFNPQPLSQRNIPRLSLVANVKSEVTSKIRKAIVSKATNKLSRFLPKSLRGIVPIISSTNSSTVPKNPTFVDAAKSFRQSFYENLPSAIKNDPSTVINKSKYFNESTPTSRIAGHGVDEDGNRYIKNNRTLLEDPYNKTVDASVKSIDKINYDNIIKDQPKNSDIIKFIFRDADGGNAVHFRALISTIKESIKTEFNEQRYVGRVERFVTYGGAKRGLSLSFNIVAFSQNEINGMWSRVNYLSGLAFPKKADKGFMVPPLFKITIGELYDNQPCYIESLDYDFLDESITFDTVQEVPFAINVTMQLSILEKRSKFHDSPFYKITEEVAAYQRTVLDVNQLRRLEDIGREASFRIGVLTSKPITAFEAWKAKKIAPPTAPTGVPVSRDGQILRSLGEGLDNFFTYGDQRYSEDTNVWPFNQP